LWYLRSSAVDGKTSDEPSGEQQRRGRWATVLGLAVGGERDKERC